MSTTTSSTSPLVLIFVPSIFIVAAFYEMHGWDCLEIVLQISHRCIKGIRTLATGVPFFLARLSLLLVNLLIPLSMVRRVKLVFCWYYRPSWVARELNEFIDLVMNYWKGRIERMKSTASGVEPHNFFM